jgi:hypothetical protein
MRFDAFEIETYFIEIIYKTIGTITAINVQHTLGGALT